ncbi:hypothetical protein [Pseudoflavonifractor sp. An44]|uniref:hypothetical protein n=1 Tax=Pseudoflavonifractor sp. An44 TaxID=1965635 RepID=UPI001302BF0F
MKKEQERDELHHAIWTIANKLWKLWTSVTLKCAGHHVLSLYFGKPLQLHPQQRN